MTTCGQVQGANGDLLLGSMLEHMCDRNDHETVLHVLQALSKVRRAGYLTIKELVMCLTYCGNRFAEKGNGEFFKEYIKFMPDINKIGDTMGCFSPLCKSYYYAHKNAEHELDKLQTTCLLLDTCELLEWFQQFIIKNRINCTFQLGPLFSRAIERGDTLTNDVFKQFAEGYRVPVEMKSGI